MSVHNGHRSRVREKFLKNGLEHMHPHEVLEMLLFFAIPQGDTNAIAHGLLREFGDFKSVFSASYDQLVRVKGIGNHAATLILFFTQAFRYYERERAHDIILDNTEDIGHYLLSQFAGKTRETVLLLCLDTKFKLIQTVFMGEGSVNAANINVRKVVEIALRYNVAGMVMSHNHPGGLALPSPEDIVTTERVRDALGLLNVRLLDHIIVTDDDFVSFADSNML